MPDLTIPTDHHILLAVQRQVAALVAERNALRDQVTALVAERDALRNQVADLTVACTAADTWIHTAQPGPMTPEARTHCEHLVAVIGRILRPEAAPLEAPHA